MSDWICKNMAIEISLIYLLTESCSEAFSFLCFFRLLFIYLICTEYLLNNPPPPHKKKGFSSLLIILSLCQFEISVHMRLNSALIVGCLRVFLAALGKVFWKASLKPYEGKIPTTFGLQG